MHASFSPDRRTLLRDVRLSKGLTQAAVAIESGASIGYVQRVESGLWPKRRQSPAFVAVLEVLELSEDQIRGGAAA